jgi:hypothetical protein
MLNQNKSINQSLDNVECMERIDFSGLDQSIHGHQSILGGLLNDDN